MGSETPVEIFVAVYPDQATAKQMINSLQQAQKAGVIELIDAAQVSKNEKGQIHTEELRELTARKGAVRGAVVGAVLGVIFPPTLLAGALVGGAAGGLIGKLRDSGIKTKELESLATDLQPGEVAVLAIVEDKWIDQLTAAIQGYERMSRHALDANAAAVIMADPVSGVVAGSAFETTDDSVAAAAFVAVPGEAPQSDENASGDVPNNQPDSETQESTEAPQSPQS